VRITAGHADPGIADIQCDPHSPAH
jgi:hypothetical protein